MSDIEADVLTTSIKLLFSAACLKSLIREHRQVHEPGSKYKGDQFAWIFTNWFCQGITPI